MHKNAKRLQKLINELLDLSQIEEGKLKLQVQETDPSSLKQVILKNYFDRKELIEYFGVLIVI